jgi:hypothetical protein
MYFKKRIFIFPKILKDHIEDLEEREKILFVKKKKKKKKKSNLADPIDY